MVSSPPLAPTQDPVKPHVLRWVGVSSAKPVLFSLRCPGNAYLNCNILFPQAHHAGQPPSLRVRKHIRRGDALKGKHLYDRGEHIRDRRPVRVLHLRQLWVAVLTTSGLSLFFAITPSFIFELGLSSLQTVKRISWCCVCHGYRAPFSIFRR